jgi:hypothetical protein
MNWVRVTALRSPRRRTDIWSRTASAPTPARGSDFRADRSAGTTRTTTTLRPANGSTTPVAPRTKAPLRTRPWAPAARSASMIFASFGRLSARRTT